MDKLGITSNKQTVIEAIQNIINEKKNLKYKYLVSLSKNGDLNLWAIDSSEESENKIIFAPKAKLLIAFFDKEENYKFSLEDTYAGETELFDDLILNDVLKTFFSYGSIYVEEVKRKNQQKKFLIKVFSGNFGYLFFDKNDNEYYTGSIQCGIQSDTQKALFTTDEINQLKAQKNIAIDWSKVEFFESRKNDD